MRPAHDARHPDEAAERAARDPKPDELGPQGAALVLELQRLRRAFDSEIRSNQDAARAQLAAPDTSAQPIRAQASRRKRRKKGKLVRVVEFWLEQFGFKSAAPAERSIEPPDEAPVTPPRHPGQSLLPPPLLSKHLTKPRPEIPAPHPPPH